jgi:hypothetical protein
MNELKGKQGLKREGLIHFHRASLHTAFPFGYPWSWATARILNLKEDID